MGSNFSNMGRYIRGEDILPIRIYTSTYRKSYSPYSPNAHKHCNTNALGGVVTFWSYYTPKGDKNQR